MKKILIFSTLMFLGFNLFAQETFPQIYDPKANGKIELEQAIAKAKEQNKFVFVMIGFNRCPWCQMFHKFIQDDVQIDSLLQANFVSLMVNYDKENKNMDVMQQLEYPNRFGFPVFVVLNQDGRKLHTQNSAYLEEGKGYNRKEVFQFFKQWSPEALKPENYK